MTLTFAGVTSVLLLAEFFLSPTVEDVVPSAEFKRQQAMCLLVNQTRRSRCVGSVYPLQGRWRLGPEDAPIRLVMFTDPQCPDCKRVHGELETILEVEMTFPSR